MQLEMKSRMGESTLSHPQGWNVMRSVLVYEILGTLSHCGNEGIPADSP